MGKERDELIRRLGGTPISDLEFTDEEIIRLASSTMLYIENFIRKFLSKKRSVTIQGC